MFGQKKTAHTPTEQKCQTSGCLFTCNDPVTLKKHTDWAHSEKAKAAGAK